MSLPETMKANRPGFGQGLDLCVRQAHPNSVGILPNGQEIGPAAPVRSAGIIIYKDLMSSDMRPGQKVTISGIGGLGHMIEPNAILNRMWAGQTDGRIGLRM